MKQQETPIYTARHRASIMHYISPAIVVLLLALGIRDGNPASMIFAGALAVYIWITRHSRYEIYPDRLEVRFLSPRRIVVSFADIRDVRAVGLTLSSRGLIVEKRSGWPIVINPADSEAFREELNKAREPYATEG